MLLREHRLFPQPVAKPRGELDKPGVPVYLSKNQCESRGVLCGASKLDQVYTGPGLQEVFNIFVTTVRQCHGKGGHSMNVLALKVGACGNEHF